MCMTWRRGTPWALGFIILHGWFPIYFGSLSKKSIKKGNFPKKEKERKVQKKKGKQKKEKDPTGRRNRSVRWTSRALTRRLASLGRETPGAGTTTHPVTSQVTITLPPHRALSAFSAAPSHHLFPLVYFPSTFTLCFQQLCYVICTIIQLCNYCLIVLILDLSAAYPKHHIFLRRADFVSPGNRSSNLSQVPPVGCRSPLCAW
jgi:hypothetical protein